MQPTTRTPRPAFGTAYAAVCRTLPGLHVHTPRRNVLVLLYSALALLVAVGLLLEMATP